VQSDGKQAVKSHFLLPVRTNFTDNIEYTLKSPCNIPKNMYNSIIPMNEDERRSHHEEDHLQEGI
jgi:hypothetical protein